MQTALKLRIGICVLALGLLLTSCKALTGLEEAPEWARDFTSQLRCGMTLKELESLTDREFRPLTSMLFVPDSRELEGYFLSDTWASVILQFEDHELVSYSRTFVNGFKSVQTSPLVNLCTGELKYQVRIYNIGDGVVFVNGEKKEDPSEVFLGIGEYEIRIERAGDVPILQTLTLRDDREAHGIIYWVIEDGEIVPLDEE